MFGFDADEMLTVNREEIKDVNAVYGFLESVERIWLEKFVENIDEIIAKHNDNPTMNFYGIALGILGSCGRQSDTCPCCTSKKAAVDKLLTSSLLPNIRGFSLTEGKYEYGGISAKTLVKGILREPKFEIPIFRDVFNDYQKSQEWLEHIHEHSKENPVNEMYLSQSPLIDYLQGYYDLVALCDSNGNVYFQIKTTQQVKATEFPNFIETLISSDFSRIGKNQKQIFISNCIRPYDVLALKPGYFQELPEEFQLTVSYLRQRIVSPDMVIPITGSHLFVLKHNPPVKDEFVSNMINSLQFEEIVKFTHNFQYQARCHSTEEIVDCYKTLISDIYDVCIKFPCRRCGTHCDIV